MVAVGRTVRGTVRSAYAKRDVIKTADWILDLGPEGGVKGGEIIAEGTPEVVAKEPRSFTARYLAPLLERKVARETVAAG